MLANCLKLMSIKGKDVFKVVPSLYCSVNFYFTLITYNQS